MGVYLEGGEVSLLGLGQLAGSGLALSRLRVGDVRGIGQLVYQPLAHILCHFAHASRLGKVCLCSCSESSPADQHAMQTMEAGLNQIWELLAERCVGSYSSSMRC